MPLKNPFKATPLVATITTAIFEKRNPRAYAISNFGNGPVLHTMAHRSRLKDFLVDLRQGEKTFYLDIQSKPPYFILLEQDGQGHPANLVLYHESPDPLLEYSIGTRPLEGQILAYGMSPDGSGHSVVHTLYSPTYNNVLVASDREFSCSTATADHPELCKHLALCGQSIFYFMNLLRQNQLEDEEPENEKGDGQ